MEYSKNGIELTARFEGCKLLAYQDSVGVWTIGYGHTKGVTKGMSCTQQQAEEWLKEDVMDAVRAVNKYVKVDLSQNQFDALVDFTFNLGSGSLSSSTLLKYLNKGSFDLAANEFEKWCHAGGKVLKGLYARRIAEKEMFLKGKKEEI